MIFSIALRKPVTQIKHAAIVGNICTVFPIQSIWQLLGQNEKPVKFKFATCSFFCSILVFVLIIMCSLPVSLDYVYTVSKSVKTPTDAFTIQGYLLCYFFHRFISYILCVLKTWSLVNLINHVQAYDQKHKLRNLTELLDLTGLIVLFYFVMEAFGNCIASRNIVYDLVKADSNCTTGVYRYALLYIFGVETTSALFYIFHFIAETSNVFSIILILFYSRGLIDRLQSFQTQLAETSGGDRMFHFLPVPLAINEKKRNASYASNFMHRKNSCMHSSYIVSQIKNQWLDLVNMNEKLESYCEDYLLFITTFTIVCEILGMHSIMISTKFHSHSLNLIDLIFSMLFGSSSNSALSISLFYFIFRLVIFVNIGEKLHKCVSFKHFINGL